MVSIYQVVSHILQEMGYKLLAKEAMIATAEDIDIYIKFIRFKLVKNKELVEFIDHFL